MPLDRFASSSRAVDATRPTGSPDPLQYEGSSPTSFEPLSSRSKRPPRPVLEPSVNTGGRSSSPRAHSFTSPSAPRRTSAVSATLAPAYARAHPTLSTPQQHATPPTEWPDDDISLPSLGNDNALATAAGAGWSPDTLQHFYISDDHFLSDLVNNDFSSPSSYPPLTRPQPPTPGPPRRGHHHQRGPHSHSPNTHRAPQSAPRSLDNLSRSNTLNSASTSFDSARSHVTNDASADSFHETSQSSLGSDDMPPTTRRRTHSHNVVDVEAVRSAAAPRPDRRRNTPATTQTAPVQSTNRHKRVKLDDGDPFEDIDPKASTVTKGDDELYMIDLTEPEKPPEESEEPSEEPPENDNRTKLSAFQCAICMDDVTALTVTHCGKSNIPTCTMHYANI